MDQDIQTESEEEEEALDDSLRSIRTHSERSNSVPGRTTWDESEVEEALKEGGMNVELNNGGRSSSGPQISHNPKVEARPWDDPGRMVLYYWYQLGQSTFDGLTRQHRMRGRTRRASENGATCQLYALQPTMQTLLHWQAR